jgi:serine/threonine protein kinase
MADWIGRTLGRVRIESLVARGGVAEIYLGRHTTLQRDVAVKILRSHFEDDSRSRERFELEARAVARLRHPNIVQVFDFDTIDDQPYIVMEYISGPSLSRYLAALHDKNSRLGLPLIGKILTGVANALQYAHESGVVHRDVKPGNILLTSRSLQIIPGETLPVNIEPVLTDFGLVRMLDSSHQTTIGQTAGTPAYMSPEQAMGIATDGRTDIYSLGIVLYEMLSGQVPFDGETTMSILLKHLNEAPPPIPGLSPALQEVLDHALAKHADDRFQEPKEFAAAFNAALLETADASTVVPIPPVSRSSNKPPIAVAPRRNYWRPAILAGSLIALLVAALLFKGMIPAASIQTPTLSAVSDTPTQFVPLSLGPTGVLRLEDGNALLDRATLIAQAMPAPPAGSQYQVWLWNGEEQLPLGSLSVDGSGRGTLTYDDPLARNLLTTYSGVEITVRPGSDADANGSERLAYFYALPDAGLTYLRGLMVSFPTTPQQRGLIHGLNTNAQLIDRAAKEMLRAHENGNETGAKENAESILNLLVGSESENHKDWNGDGQVSDPGDGYGLLQNEGQLGYIQAVYSYADYAVNSSGASRNIIVNGENVKTCAQNLARWAPELRDHLLTIFTTSPSNLDEEIQRSAALADEMLNGADVNENGKIEAIPDECGVLIARESTYRMADMPLLPVSTQETPTAVNGSITTTQTASTPGISSATATRRPQNQSPATVTPATQPSSNQPPGRNTRVPRPTREPKPTKRP